MHIRTYLRRLVRDQLLNKGEFGDRVYTNRLAAFSNDELPALIVTTNDEEITGSDIHGSHEREVLLEIEVHEKALDDVDDALDTHLVVIEQAMERDEFMLADTEMVLTDVAFDAVSTNFGNETEQTTGLMTVSYTLTYETQAGMPELEN